MMPEKNAEGEGRKAYQHWANYVTKTRSDNWVKWFCGGGRIERKIIFYQFTTYLLSPVTPGGYSGYGIKLVDPR